MVILLALGPLARRHTAPPPENRQKKVRPEPHFVFIYTAVLHGPTKQMMSGVASSGMHV
ncbi:hypothetical protein LHGZ1_2775 [Laribacter hongkongensis]|uniref:Uncharacterized protein n=1 Tax=Laribacter hongkongensis TaxID=168471 RepID=A0A248LML6_9NEIS|nr:hypothetical protein LHGZ1_2775 [Laribacter hongkongensis]